MNDQAKKGRKLMSRKERRRLAKESGVPFKAVGFYEGAKDPRWELESDIENKRKQNG